ncbi:hypothetical protein TNCV_4094941 [Trichonephila clavipes]|uniref:Uncharacterized protein n=1 Tax=Trichonephila clavipes TaxID=2585209 RepID=A0A8X6VCK6_TRICX|nr:hypothetical protein TNCV_4094941 [Trichonephila clavipes]
MFSETKRKLDLTGASEMNRLYPKSRRESSNENQYLNTLPRRGGGWKKKRPDENETKVRYAGRNGGAQGRGLNSPKNAWNEKENGDYKTELAAGTSVESKQEPALITDPSSDVSKCI